MDPATAVHLPPAKRPVDHPSQNDPTPLKKPRTGLTTKKVAEIILLLSAMAEMRGGRSPTQPELDLMAEARAKLVEVCESTLTPKDLVSKEAVEALIDDLGLGKRIEEQNVVVGPPKLSIADKLLQTKKKMEEDAKVLKAKLAVSGSAVAASSIGHVHGSISGSSVYPLTSNNGKPRLISGVLNHNTSNPSSFSLPGAVKPLYGGPRPVAAGSSFDHGQRNTSTWSVQPQTLSFSRYGNDKVSTTSRSEETASRVNPQANRDQPPRAFGSHIPTHESQHETTTGQGAPLVNSHNEISKTVHKLLQKQVSDRPTWTPPSRDYMTKAVMCQVCHYSVNDVEYVFLCDACEHAYHFRCLPSSNQKVVPRGEWHCPKCLQLSNGKPLPPKYGRVTRNVTASNALSKVAGFQSSDHKANMQRVRPVDPQAVITGTAASSTRFPDRREVQGSTNAKNSNQSGVIGGPLEGSTYVNSAQHLKTSSLQVQAMTDATPRPVVKQTDMVHNVPECEQTSDGLSTGEHFAWLHGTISNMPGGSSARNDLLIPESGAKLSDTETQTSSSQQSGNNSPKQEFRLPESSTHTYDQEPAKIASATQLTNVLTETADHDHDQSERSSLKAEMDPAKIASASQIMNVLPETAEREASQNKLSTLQVEADLAKIASATQLVNVLTEMLDCEPVPNESSSLKVETDPAKITSGTWLTEINTETADHEPDKNELSNHKVEIVTPVPGTNTSGLVDNLSGTSRDQLSEPYNKESE